MVGFLGNLYPWVKAGHLIFVIFWMAALFMYPRMLVYHQESEKNSEEATNWIDRENRLARIIMNPSMIIVWMFGILLMLNYGLKSSDALGPVGWLHSKLLLVIALSGYHGWMISYAKKLARGDSTLSNRTLRLVNEVPGIATVIIVILVIVKPF